MTPIYHAEASAQAEALATAAGCKAGQRKQGKRSCGGLWHKLPCKSFGCIDGIYPTDINIFIAFIGIADIFPIYQVAKVYLILLII